MILTRTLAQSIKLRMTSANRFSQVRLTHEVSKSATQEFGKPQPAHHPPTNWEKKCLVYMGRYPSVESIPPTIPISQIEKVRSQIRIRLNILTMILSTIGLYIFYNLGKKQALTGDTAITRRQEEIAASRSSS